MTKTIDGTKQAAKLRKLADGMTAKIEHGRRPLTQASTPKRERERASRVIDADNLERAQRACRALADAYERGDVPDVLLGVKIATDDIRRLVRHGYDSSGGYYTIVSTHKYVDTSPAGVALQAMLDAKVDPAEAADLKRRRDLEAKLADMRRCNVPGFFPTPDGLADQLVECVRDRLRPDCDVLEPSAGIGSLVEAVLRVEPKANVDCVERLHSAREILILKGFAVPSQSDAASHDFETFEPSLLYDAVLMNPPFEKGLDAAHVMRAFSMLKPGGRLAAIMSPGPFIRQDRKSEVFRDWFELNGGRRLDVDPGQFRGVEAFRQTGTSCCIVVLDRP